MRWRTLGHAAMCGAMWSGGYESLSTDAAIGEIDADGPCEHGDLPALPREPTCLQHLLGRPTSGSDRSANRGRRPSAGDHFRRLQCPGLSARRTSPGLRGGRESASKCPPGTQTGRHFALDHDTFFALFGRGYLEDWRQVYNKELRDQLSAKARGYWDAKGWMLSSRWRRGSFTTEARRACSLGSSIFTLTE